MPRDPKLVDDSVRRYTNLPGGHGEGWADAFKNLMARIYGFIASGRDPVTADAIEFPTFEDGYRSNCVIDAIVASHAKGGWVDVEY
jgi:predicted dehydrogenase